MYTCDVGRNRPGKLTGRKKGTMTAMIRYFNTEGICRPNEHYMVRLDARIKKIKAFYVDREKYFVINRGRQYGKTTTLEALAEYLQDEYIIFFVDFQMMSTTSFADEWIFVEKFIGLMHKIYTRKKEMMTGIDTEAFQELLSMKENGGTSMDQMFEGISRVCEMSERPVVLIIDEVDSASNNKVFIDFLAMLRAYYLSRRTNPFFQSVILAGVYDIKNLKLKIRPDENHQYNSPWNIAATFELPMSFSTDQIAGMLNEYEADHRTGMDVEEIAGMLYQYTSGYPYLVSAICKVMDEKLPYQQALTDAGGIWTRQGVEEAVKIVLRSRTTLFDSMIKHISEYPDLKQMLYAMLFRGESISYNEDNHTIELGRMFGYIVDDGVNVRVANRIFETRLYNLFLSEEELASVMSRMAKQDRSRFVSDGRLNMVLVLQKFVAHFSDIYGENDTKFVEDHGRKFFLLYLRPIINGVGNYYIEAQTRDAGRTDIIVDYAGEQFVVEMKIWRGNEYNERGEEQLAGYLDYFHQNRGYMLSFNFNKKKEIGVKTITVGEKEIVEAVV